MLGWGRKCGTESPREDPTCEEMKTIWQYTPNLDIGCYLGVLSHMVRGECEQMELNRKCSHVEKQWNYPFVNLSCPMPGRMSFGWEHTAHCKRDRLLIRVFKASLSPTKTRKVAGKVWGSWIMAVCHCLKLWTKQMWSSLHKMGYFVRAAQRKREGTGQAAGLHSFVQ